MTAKAQRIGGWRGGVLAAVIALLAGAPLLIALPVTEPAEARFAAASAEMVDGGGLTLAQVQGRPRPSEPPAAHWLQAAAVSATGMADVRQIWAYRLASLIVVAMTAAVMALAGEKLFGAPGALTGAVLFATSTLAVGLGGQATAAALFTAAMTGVFYALARIYKTASATLGGKARSGLFWPALTLGVMAGGLEAFALPVLACVGVAAADRRARWLMSLAGGWGALFLAAVFGGWLSAVAVESDGGVFTFDWFWSGGRGFGLQTALLPALSFPAVFALPFAAAYAWGHRQEAPTRLALAWTLLGWIALELMPGQSVHGAAALYPPLFTLAGAGLAEAAGGWRARIGGALAQLATGFALAALWLVFALRAGEGQDRLVIGLAGAAIAAAAVAGAAAAIRVGRLRTLALALLLGVAAQWLAAGLVLPGLASLWPARAMLTALGRAGLDPRGGLARGPVATVGFDSGVLAFALDDQAQPGDAANAAAALADGRPAIVDDRAAAALAGRGDVVSGFKGRNGIGGEALNLWLLAPKAQTPPGVAPDGAVVSSKPN